MDFSLPVMVIILKSRALPQVHSRPVNLRSYFHGTCVDPILGKKLNTSQVSRRETDLVPYVFSVNYLSRDGIGPAQHKIGQLCFSVGQELADATRGDNIAFNAHRLDHSHFETIFFPEA